MKKALAWAASWIMYGTGNFLDKLMQVVYISYDWLMTKSESVQKKHGINGPWA